MLLGISYCYLLFLAFLVFQNTEDARSLLGWIDAKLGKPLPEKEYATHCDVFTPDDPHSSFANVKTACLTCMSLLILSGGGSK
jgi:Phosphatidyl serine synthase.